MTDRIIVMNTGMILLMFGYLICVEKKYHLIKWFKEDHEAGRKDQGVNEKNLRYLL